MNNRHLIISSSIIVIILVALFLQPLRYKRIDAGHTGIKFNYFGITDEKGVSDHELVSGTVFYNKYTRGVFEYPHYWQDANYEDISFNSREGEPIVTNLKVVYRLIKNEISSTFDEYRLPPKKLQETIIKTIVLEQLSNQAGKMSAVDIMGAKRESLLKLTRDELNKGENSKNFEFQLVAFTDDLKASDNVKLAIQGVIKAQEAAKTAQANTVKIEERATQKLITARADSAERVIIASGKAEEMKLIQKQLNSSPDYIRYIKANRWDGKLPNVTGGVIPYLDIEK
jgi:regulator of protease activity HflC (stomatin/prohibitin superfamily)